jgi:nucleoside-diphosphate-sugar epimerase
MANVEQAVTRVFLSGCTGELGSRLSLLLLNLGYEVFGVHGPRGCSIKHSKHRCMQIDLLNEAARAGMEDFGPEIFVHTAWLTTPTEFWESDQNFEWITASQRLICEFMEQGGKYLVVTGSCAEYSWDTPEPLNENSPEFPASAYGKAKLELLNWIRNQDIPFLWTRTFFQFGMNEPKGRLIPSLIDAFNAEREFVVRSGEDVRDFVFVDDVARVLALLISQRSEGVVNVGTGIKMDVATLSKGVAELFSRPDLLQFEAKKSEKSIVISDPKKLNSMIGNFAWLSLRAALIRTIEARKRH